jgi:TonB family protein
MKNKAFSESENRMKLAFALLALAALRLEAQDKAPFDWHYHQVPDQDGIYYTGPEVTAPTMLKTVYVAYPTGITGKDAEGMTVFALVIGPDGIPAHIQTLKSHGEVFDRAALAALKHSTFAPGKLDNRPVPVWIDVRVVFTANRAPTTPQVLITERDLPAPDDSRYLDKNKKLLSYTPPFLIHSVDADFPNPTAKHPYVQVAVVTVLVSEQGLPKDVRVVRGLGFGLDQKAAAAVAHYKFLPATKKGVPVEARSNVNVSFVEF